MGLNFKACGRCHVKRDISYFIRNGREWKTCNRCGARNANYLAERKYRAQQRPQRAFDEEELLGQSRLGLERLRMQLKKTPQGEAG